MPVITKLRDAIRSSRRRMQVGLSQNAEKSGLKTGATRQKRHPAERTNTAQPRFIDSGRVVMRLK